MMMMMMMMMMMVVVVVVVVLAMMVIYSMFVFINSCSFLFLFIAADCPLQPEPRFQPRLIPARFASTARSNTVVPSFHSFAASSKSILLEFILFNPAK
jgi:hypothetical protein